VRTIKKRGADRYLAQRHANPPQSYEIALPAWENYRRKKETKILCISEQYGLCGYSQISLNNKFPILDESNEEISRELGAHLEHVEPKSLTPQKTFDHNNLIASAIDDAKARHLIYKDVFGGHAKLSWFNPTSFISPLLNNCQDYFHYETSGLVVPKESLPNRREKAKARLTIYKLNLNAPLLVNWRKIWLEALDTIIDEAEAEALIHIANTELLPTNGELRPFHSAQRQLLGNIGERVCEEYGL